MTLLGWSRIAIAIGGACLLLAAMLWAHAYYVRWDCDNVERAIGRETFYQDRRCYVNINGYILPLDNWRWSGQDPWQG